METTKSSWLILNASVTGTSHQKVGRDCEDQNSYYQCENGTLLVAVADGAGSASRASEGAQQAVNKALETMKEEFEQVGEPTNQDEWRSRLNLVLEKVHASLQNLADNTKQTEQIIEPRVNLPSKSKVNDSEREHAVPLSPSLPLREYATTLLLSVVTARWIAIAQVGDGIVVMQDIDRKLHLLTKPDYGEYINETNFMTDPNYQKHVQFFVQSDMAIRGIAVLTDGLQMLAVNFANSCPHELFFLPLFEIVATQTDSSKQEMEKFLGSERVCERTDDDKTIVLAVRS